MSNMQVQQMQLDKAYSVSNKSVIKNRPMVKKELIAETKEVPKPDMFDMAYVGLRSTIPSWLMFIIIVVGFVVVFYAIFKKPINAVFSNVFGFSLEDLKETVRRRKERDKELADERKP